MQDALIELRVKEEWLALAEVFVARIRELEVKEHPADGHADGDGLFLRVDV